MFQRPKLKDKKLRPLPFPYLGAVSISSDVEFFSFPFFEELMKFVNTELPTKLGKGLGLELTSSIFFYTTNRDTFSYFKGSNINSPLSGEASRLKDYLKSGWIDTNHSYGDFYKTEIFERGHAMRVFDELADLDVCLEIFTNHGGNMANLGSHYSFHEGDVYGSKCYHSDLLLKNGTKYIWLDFGPYNIELLDKLRPVKNLVLSWLGKKPGHVTYREKLFIDERLRDMVKIKGFVRFRSTGRFGPDLCTLSNQMMQVNWDRLYAENGVIIFYQHLGVFKTSSTGICTSASIENVKKDLAASMGSFYFLKNEKDTNNLWVCGTQRLLRYMDIVQSSEIVFDVRNNLYRLKYDGELSVHDPQFYFQGLTFYSDRDPVKLYYNATEIKLENNKKDETGRTSFSIPIKLKENIW